MVSQKGFSTKYCRLVGSVDFIIIFCKKCGTFFRFSIEKSFYLLYNVADEGFYTAISAVHFVKRGKYG